jgi:hypothetical protein
MLWEGRRYFNGLIQEFAEGNAVQRNRTKLLKMAVHELAIQQPKATQTQTRGQRDQSNLRRIPF